MGKVTFTQAYTLANDITSHLCTFIIDDVLLVSETVVFKLNINNLNLHKLVNIIPSCLFEGELFPSLTVSHFAPLHINVFSTGKVVVLGRNAADRAHEIYLWLCTFIEQYKTL